MTHCIVTSRIKIKPRQNVELVNIVLTRKCTLWRCKSTPTPKAKLLWMT